MRRLTLGVFENAFPRRQLARTIEGSPGQTIVVDDDALVKGMPRDVTVRSGVYAEIEGLVEESLTVERGAVVYVRGLVDGAARLDGAMCICDGGHVAGKVWGAPEASVVDPTEPAGSLVKF